MRRDPRPACAASIFALVAGCFAQPGVAEGGSSTENASEATTQDPASAGSTAIGSGDTAPAESGTGLAATSSTGRPLDESTTTQTTGTRDCGGLGAACCEADACDEGACLAGTCVAFAGAYLDGELCDSCPAVLGRGCECPRGFDVAGPYPILSPQCIKNTPEPWDIEVLYLCQAPEYVPGRADFAGAFLAANDDDDACVAPGACVVGNSYADGMCACPEESEAIEIPLFGYCESGETAAPPALLFTLCRGTGDLVTFGGAYLDQTPPCLIPHPDTEQCTCPNGTVAEVVRTISSAVPNLGANLGFCVRDP